MSAIITRRLATNVVRGSLSLTSAKFPAMARLYASKSFPPHTVIGMPALSPTMTQGNVGTWQKHVGDRLEPGEVLVEIETDKASMDMEFQDEGYLAKILLEAGAKDVPVGRPIGVYVEDEKDVAAFADFTAADAADPTAKDEPPAEQPKEEATSEPASQSGSSAASSESSAEHKPEGGRIFASPIAKAIALEKGIPLKDVKGSGPGGRIIKRDVEGYKAPAAAAAPASAAASAPAGAPAAAPAATANYTDTPISSMRKTIAARLTESKQTNPDYIVSSTVSVSKLLKLRAALNASADGAYKLSVNDILVKAVAAACQAVPQANSHWLAQEGVIRQFANVDVSVAVATPSGLITPVVKNVDAKGLKTISAEIKALGKKARDGKLAPHEYQGGTITISNMGMNNAVSLFTAIINPPQSTILAVGTTQRTAVEDPEAESGVSFDDTINLTASFDHKVVDGAVGAEWMKALKKVLENPLELLL